MLTIHFHLQTLIKKSVHKGQLVMSMVLLTFIFFTLFLGVYYTISHTSIVMSGYEKAAKLAFEAAHSGISQAISDILNHVVVNNTTNIFNGTVEKDYPILVRDSVIVTSHVKFIQGTYESGAYIAGFDLEGHSLFSIESEASESAVIGGTTGAVKRKVRATVAVGALPSYNVFLWADQVSGNDNWTGFGCTLASSNYYYDGPFHANGTNYVRGIKYWNSGFLQGGLPNPFYNSSYITMVKDLKASSDTASPYLVARTQNNETGTYSWVAGYSICDSVNSEGTWFCGKNYKHAATTGIQYELYRENANAIISLTDLPNYSLRSGAGFSFASSNALTADVHVAGVGPHIKIRLDKFGTGEVEDIFQDSSHYNEALNSTYGAVIYCKGNVAVWGELAPSSVYNNNKKVTIISDSNIEIIGDVLYSGDSYNSAATSSWSLTPQRPVPATSNPNRDAIALIAGGNIYVNPWRNNATGIYAIYFKREGDMKIDAFLNSYCGFLGGRETTGRVYEATSTEVGMDVEGGAVVISNITIFGSSAFRYVSTLPISPNGTGPHIIFDSTLADNLKGKTSVLVPLAVKVYSWQQVR